MTHKSFVVSDTHFTQTSMYRFTDACGNRIRPWAETAEEADALMIEAWNATVRPNDKVYHLGDVSKTRSGLKILGQLNGTKILIRGNHDIFKLQDFAEHFKDVRGTHKIGRLILSHYPIHPDSIPHWAHGNIHGHIHEKRVLRRSWLGRRAIDPRYLNVCVEAIGLAPAPIEEIEARLIAQRATREWITPAWWKWQTRRCDPHPD